MRVCQRRPRAPGALSVVAVVAAALIVLVPGAALAHGSEDESPAKDLVEQAIALIRSQPEQAEAIEDKIHDAIEAEDAEGVDLALLERADRAFDAGRVHEAQDLLEEAIGAKPHRVVASPEAEEPEAAEVPEVEEPDAAEEPVAESSPVLHERALEGGPEAPEGVGDSVLLALAGVLALSGLAVARRVR